MHFLKIARKAKQNRSKNILTKLGIFACLALFFIGINPIYAISDEEQLQNLNREIQSAQRQLSAVKGQKASLQRELTAFDIRINSIQLQINAAQYQINILDKQISQTSQKITKAETDLKQQQELMSEYLKTMYIEGQVSTIELIAKSENFSDFVNQSEYMSTMQENVQDTANKIVELKSQLIEEKKQQEIKKSKAEQLKSQQVAQRSEIESQRSGRQYVFDQTKGSESNYKTYIANLQAKYNSLQREVWSRVGGGNYTSLGHVNRGDIIGGIGNSGYSSGCHLHFEIRINSNTHVNPANYLGNGYFINPVPGVTMNVPYGYSDAYFPGVFHTGQDYADGCAGRAIRATADGEIITRVTGQPNTYPGGPVIYGNYVMIKHTNGMYSLYGHMR
jgi:septal ring factor EnvC (AmiA/AmiB activator)